MLMNINESSITKSIEQFQERLDAMTEEEKQILFQSRRDQLESTKKQLHRSMKSLYVTPKQMKIKYWSLNI